MVAYILLLLLWVGASASEFDSPHVQNLGKSDFVEKVSDGKVYFIKFYAPWCGHCKRLGPTWGQLGEAVSSNKNVVIAHVDCTVAKDTCSQFEVKGYPTLKVIHQGKEYKAYRGDRSLDALKSFILDTAKELTGETEA